MQLKKEKQKIKIFKLYIKLSATTLEFLAGNIWFASPNILLIFEFHFDYYFVKGLYCMKACKKYIKIWIKKNYINKKTFRKKAKK